MTQRVWKDWSRGWASPPLVVQILALLIGALVVAQLVTLLLTLVLPPEPPRRYEMGDIAAALRGEHSSRPFERRLQAGPPDLAARGWLVSPTTTAQLARAVGLGTDRVVFGFYTELPIGGLVGTPPPRPQQLPADARPTQAGPPVATAEPIAAARPIAAHVLKQAKVAIPVLALMAPVAVEGGQEAVPPPPPPQQAGSGATMPPTSGSGRAIPGSGFPGNGFPPGGIRPEGGLPRPPGSATGRDGRFGRGGIPDITVARDPRTQQPIAVQLGHSAGSTGGAAVQLRGGDAGRSGDAGRGSVTTPSTGTTDPAVATGRSPADAAFGRRDPGEFPRLDRPFTPVLPQRLTTAPAATTTPSRPQPILTTTRAPLPLAKPRVADPIRALTARPVAVATTSPIAVPSAGAVAGTTAPRPQSVPTAAPTQRALPIVRPATGLFGLSAAPFVEGDFVAAVRTADGRWAVVSPAEEGFPNAWQRRVLLWFGLSLLAVAPIAWAFARRIVGPLQGFADAAEMLGRDPSAAILPLEGPAEVGRAAHAFNQMQSRLRSFVDDRTAMIGAISHDLRTPLTRLRFRIEDVPEEQHEGLLGEITAMEAMISSVISYMRDAAAPGVRERRDMAELVGDVVEDAALIGGDVRTVKAETAPVDIDALGIRRVLDNLLTNAMKYGGGTARVALTVEDACAIADIVDDGPGIPDAELERVFEPFYRSESARASSREGSGLGLAVCRSIARAHGGDVRLFRSPQGFTARVTLPLAYDGERQLAA